MGRELTERVDDLSHDVRMLRGDGGDDREGGRDGDGEGGHPHFWHDEVLESFWLFMEGDRVAPMGGQWGGGTDRKDGGGGDRGGGPDGRGGGGGDRGRGPDGGQRRWRRRRGPRRARGRPS
ncbi:rRNA 2'-O-methyltransferase fibrillarin-like [Olea europaea var. sylvestris]|uniref:rRNA 2'-O-methyltransferase fibrillarin-like n=1 Tax=Olea europaea var. sylvestris TaxID=158386 RepID=UPI000C1D8519|nr:rRNA 2'-O-methyltransferase fibrillarin-like [Olea europaea var. sylvestris]